MAASYNQRRALWAITKASFKAIFAQPSSIFFSLLFPIIFILIFGAFQNGGGSRSTIAFETGTDTLNPVYAIITKTPFLEVKAFSDTAAMFTDVRKGHLVAVLNIEKVKDSVSAPQWLIHVKSSTASANSLPQLMQVLENISLKAQVAGLKPMYRVQPEIREGKKYRNIDFLLPGQIGFSILFATLFGVAFTFYNLREQLVLKRFYASPVKKINILIGIGVSRLFFQLLNVIALVLFGHFFLHFTLQHGIVTVLEIIFFSIVMLFLLMGVALIISSLVKSDSSIPLFINVFAFPQMMLAGTFFPLSVFPQWLQNICYYLPLTQFNNAMRKISFDGLHVIDCWKELGILAIWIAVVYAIVVRVIRWE